MIVLVGFMGAGKTTVGNLLAARLGLPFTDSDQVIEQRAGRPVRQIFAEDGEPAFRALEHQVIAELLDSPALVLALGGGAAEHPRTREVLTPGERAGSGGMNPKALLDPSGPEDNLPPGPPLPWVVYLQVGYEQAMLRVSGDTDRPMLARPDLAAIYERRLPLYAAVATLTVPTDGRHPDAITEDVLTHFAQRTGRRRTRAAPFARAVDRSGL